VLWLENPELRAMFVIESSVLKSCSAAYFARMDETYSDRLTFNFSENV